MSYIATICILLYVFILGEDVMRSGHADDDDLKTASASRISGVDACLSGGQGPLLFRYEKVFSHATINGVSLPVSQELHS